MGFTVKSDGGGDFEIINEGILHGICCWLIDIGHQYSEKYSKSKQQLIIVWEVPEERIDIERDGKTVNMPRVISRKFGATLHEKAYLRKILRSWRGRDFTPTELEGFDLKTILGVHCQLQIIHNKKDDKTFANIESVLPYTGNDKTKKPETQIIYFSFEEQTPIPEECPEWIVKLIKNSDEWGAAQAQIDEKIPTGNPEEKPPWEGEEAGAPF